MTTDPFEKSLHIFFFLLSFANTLLEDEKSSFAFSFFLFFICISLISSYSFVSIQVFFVHVKQVFYLYKNIHSFIHFYLLDVSMITSSVGSSSFSVCSCALILCCYFERKKFAVERENIVSDRCLCQRIS